MSETTDSNEITLDPVEDAIAAIAAGRAVVVVDDEDRENEGDIIFAAAHATTALMAWTIRHTSGVICVPMGGDLADKLELPPMVQVNQDAKGTAYTVSCDAAHGVSTGISAADRALTAKTLANPAAKPSDITRPGHIFPLRAVDGGVLQRRGHTEASVDLCALAGVEPVGVIAEIVHDDGEMMRLPALREFANEFNIPLISIEDLVAYRESLGDKSLSSDLEAVVTGGPTVSLPTPHGTFTVQAWVEHRSGVEHFSLSAPGAGTAEGSTTTTQLASEPHLRHVRIHSECLTGDVFGSYRCDCGEQLDAALEIVAKEGGTVLYLRGQEGRGIGLANKIRAYALQDQGADTVEANEQLGLPVDARNFDAAAAILHQLGHEQIRLVTNNPTKSESLLAAGIDVVENVELPIPARAENERYLRTKRERMHHRLADEVFTSTAVTPTPSIGEK
ncbi:3,4-dihydroxy 2-butanone 4-phosphate synthase/GTP cyclohydrolase II [Neomicrococcus aestuarii]|uniref:Multifunctional fusion protein n=1 Tax=Neomicrococcus aestuarii TaxID=556325 RepID=A0A7W8X2F4_9MICC|nr:3,4-dihydroxy-2-butanone-4-phosphate synthase [Neomicrococcus aestuarii]MBB5513844.1 3,4-dihydroxy 2-butanone 4-phosphate synthase/GTP cyclohydrolase II [Neomicrococcus aestuarii]